MNWKIIVILNFTCIDLKEFFKKLAAEIWLKIFEREIAFHPWKWICTGTYINNLIAFFPARNVNVHIKLKNKFNTSKFVNRIYSEIYFNKILQLLNSIHIWAKLVSFYFVYNLIYLSLFKSILNPSWKEYLK